MTCKEMLHYIDNTPLLWGERKKLWAVLTALRGPDSDDEQLKLSTTAHIRARALPKLSNENGAFAATPECEHRTGMTIPAWNPLRDEKFIYDHFAAHIRLAAAALDLPL